MFICFHLNKLSSNKKGQLIPIFIVVLVVIIIMSLVTVNLGKVALFKTGSSNSVDAGALAAGSVMANVFNAIAQSNSKMEADYWTFFATISASFAISFMLLARTASQACPSPCSAVGTMGSFISTATAIAAAITAFWIAQHYFYCNIRKMADEGRETGIEIGHRFSFLNSGIGSALKRGRPPADPKDIAGNKNNYTSEFNQFLDKSLGHNSRYTYSWLDGQERDHSVISQIQIDPIRTYEMRVAALPYPAELALLLRARALGVANKAYLASICACYRFCRACCRSHCHAGCPCCAYWAANCGPAAAQALQILIPMAAALAGLIPAYTIDSSSCGDDLAFILTWIDDIDHNRLVRADSWQNHKGVDLAVWETRYPQVHSYSVVDFTGYGKIHPPKLRHDASMVEADKISP